MYEYLCLDVETTTFQKGNPYSKCNKLCLIGLRFPDGTNKIYDIEYGDHSYAENLREVQDTLNQAKLLIGFNIRFDLAWLRRYNLGYSHCRAFDCQLAHFVISNQQDAWPSLNQVAEHYNLGTKLDIVKEEYWKNNIDTPDIPLTILTDYLNMDLVLTEQVYLKQKQQLLLDTPQRQRLVSLSNQDLLVLLEMETNGIKLNFPGMKQASNTINEQIETIKGELNDYFSGIPAACLNYNSGDCLSALLYGGKLTETIRTVVGEYKTGPKSGQPRHTITYNEHVLPRRYEPPKGAELKKEGFFATNEETLRSIKASSTQRMLLDKILQLSKLNKLTGTYYEGLAKLHQEKDWPDDFIHGQFNMCVTRTGRLSSSSPNLQNFPPEVDQFIISRF
jgi:DNA polymerase I-like protein with 3'-5' exonuclease and polymerase domains